MQRAAQVALGATRVAFVLKGYPRLSETFIAQEIHGLQCLGLRIHIVSLRHPTDPHRHPVHEQIEAKVQYLPEYLHQEPLRVLRAWRRARRLPGYARARAVWWADLRRDPTRNRVRRFGQALVLAAELPPDISHLHAHFLHTPASVTRYCAMLKQMPWTGSAHARDIWTSAEWELREKLADCQWVVTCTAVNEHYLGGLCARAGVVELMYHGLDLARFSRQPRACSGRDGRAAEDPVMLLSVGRAVEKKGYDDLLEALARLSPDIHWRFTHIGGGALSEQLKAKAAALGISGRISWLGARAQEDVLRAYRSHDVFVLASRIASDGDRDGLPNVLVEAQSQGLVCVATRAGAIPELVEHGTSGLLVEPQRPEQLARALREVICDPELRGRLGEAGSAVVHSKFSMQGGLQRLLGKFATMRGSAALAVRAKS
ncbi:MAG: glycosyltransferase [Gammaproteobacteria bacterium]|nr:glycosyltransferase [Gammaproteobacteria bacterium]